MNRKFEYALILIVVSLIFFFTACPNTMSPFDSEVIEQIKDKSLPVVAILSPENNDEYSRTMTVS